MTAPDPDPAVLDAAEARTAAGLARGIARLLATLGYASVAEYTLGNGRRADVAGVDAKGGIVIVEIKVSVADLRGDRKWPDYLDYCDQFYFGVPAGFPLAELDAPACRPDRTGLIVGDRFGGDVVRPPAIHPVNAARRRAELIRFARLAAARLMQHNDPQAAAAWPDGRLY